MALPESTYGLASAPHTGVGIRRAASAMDVDDGYSTDPGASSRARGKRKALPALPTDVPAPVRLFLPHLDVADHTEGTACMGVSNPIISRREPL